MRSFRIFNRQSGYIVAAFALLGASLLPTLASAVQLTERSIALSSSAANAASVTYNVSFTADNTSAGSVLVQFCSNTPLMLESCTAPSGFNSASATASGGATMDTAATNQVVVDFAVASGTNTFTLAAIHNPTAAGNLYARIVTYDTSENAVANYTTTAFGGGKVDDGSVAMNITNAVNVYGSVLEALTFCVSKNTIPDLCATTAAPTLELGETVGTVKALSTSAVSTGHVYTMLSTNAATGAVVNLKSNVACGGLKRAEAAVCDIAPALTGGTIANGDAKVGVKVASGTDLGSASGAFQAGGTYNSSTYELNYAVDNLSGVTSTYGDPILDTDGAPAQGKQMDLTFGASISNSTPAGRYSADLSLVATGTF